MASYQTAPSGLQGWNDCLPTVFAGAKKSTKKRYPRLGAGSADSDTSTPASRSSSGVSLNSMRSTSVSTVASVPEAPPKADASEFSSESADFDASVAHSDDLCSKTLGLLDCVLGSIDSSSKMPSREFSYYKDRLLKEVPSLEQVHLTAVHSTVSALVDDKDVDKARGVLLSHSMVHSGISSWVPALRRVVEAYE